VVPTLYVHAEKVCTVIFHNNQLMNKIPVLIKMDLQWITRLNLRKEIQ